MTSSPNANQLLQLFQKVAPPSFFDEICREQNYHFQDGIYTPAVVVWLMIYQRLHHNQTLGAAVQALLQGRAGGLLSQCKRVELRKVSPRTGGYCQARQKLPTLVASQVTDRIVEQLRSEMQEGWPGLQRPVVLIDGSTLPLRHNQKLVQAYPPGHNQHGDNHWPVVQLVVFHDVFSGLCLRPSWGPMYGEQAVSEQALAEQALGRVPADAVVLADCNFGVFCFAWKVQQSGRPMVLRLTKARAQKISGGPLLVDTDHPVVWESSAWDQSAHPELPKGASLSGRLIVCVNPSRPQELLYLFTTLDQPGAEIVGIYKLRWNVETDLRSLKRTVDLQQIRSQSVEMVEKEILLAMAAYNLVRAVMCLAAKRENLTPRQLSFSFVQTVVEAALPGLDHAATEEEYQQRLDRMLHYAAQGTLPKRGRTRSYPREVWGRGGHFPTRKRAPKDGGLPQ